MGETNGGFYEAYCRFFVCEDHKDKTRKDNGYKIVLLAKTKKGYHNLAKMSSIAYTGFYYVPKLTRKLFSNTKKISLCCPEI
jgi:DNA polymerase-3 subunit alpha